MYYYTMKQSEKKKKNGKRIVQSSIHKEETLKEHMNKTSQLQTRSEAEIKTLTPCTCFPPQPRGTA